MIVVSDTTPLISLMKIGQLELINKLFGEIQIPDAVFDELVLNPKFVSESKQIRESNFIHSRRYPYLLFLLFLFGCLRMVRANLYGFH